MSIKDPILKKVINICKPNIYGLEQEILERFHSAFKFHSQK